MSLWGEPTKKGNQWSQPQTKSKRMAKDDPKRAHLVKTDFWGRKIYCDPETGKPLKDQSQGKVHDEGLKKPGWF